MKKNWPVFINPKHKGNFSGVPIPFYNWIAVKMKIHNLGVESTTLDELMQQSFWRLKNILRTRQLECLSYPRKSLNRVPCHNRRILPLLSIHSCPLFQWDPLPRTCSGQHLRRSYDPVPGPWLGLLCQWSSATCSWLHKRRSQALHLSPQWKGYQRGYCRGHHNRCYPHRFVELCLVAWICKTLTKVLIDLQD